MGHSLTKYTETEVDIYCDDVEQFIRNADKHELEDIAEAVEKRAKSLRIKAVGGFNGTGVRLQVYCLPVEEFMAGQVQELMNRLGVEDTLRALQAATR